MNKKPNTQPKTKVKTTSETRQPNTLGKASREQIVHTAEQLLTSDGYHMLSTRKVASACGISVGNLTYHFPNKTLLIEAVMTGVCDRYERERANIKFDKALDPHSYLQGLIVWMLDDAVTANTSALFLELWVLAKHHDFGSETLERFYKTAVGWISGSLAFYFPNTTAEQRERAAYFILTLSEGSVAVFSRPHERAVNPQDLTTFAVNAVLLTLAEPKESLVNGD